MQIGWKWNILNITFFSRRQWQSAQAQSSAPIHWAKQRNCKIEAKLLPWIYITTTCCTLFDDLNLSSIAHTILHSVRVPLLVVFAIQCSGRFIASSANIYCKLNLHSPFANWSFLDLLLYKCFNNSTLVCA